MTTNQQQGNTMSGTFCTEGFIPHLLVPYDGGTFLAPVKLRRKEFGQPGIWLSLGKGGGLQLPEAVRVGSLHAYALPGGGEILC